MNNSLSSSLPLASRSTASKAFFAAHLTYLASGIIAPVVDSRLPQNYLQEIVSAAVRNSASCAHGTCACCGLDLHDGKDLRARGRRPAVQLELSIRSGRIQAGESDSAQSTQSTELTPDQSALKATDGASTQQQRSISAMGSTVRYLR
jgi:hypothetical protein